jgi:hypothetical protein
MSSPWNEEAIQRLIASIKVNDDYPIDAMNSLGKGRTCREEGMLYKGDYLIDPLVNGLTDKQFETSAMLNRQLRKSRQNPFKQRF